MPWIPLIRKQRHNRIGSNTLKTKLLLADLNLWKYRFSFRHAWYILRLGKQYLELLYLPWMMFLLEGSFFGCWELLRICVDVLFLGWGFFLLMVIVQEVLGTFYLKNKSLFKVLDISIQETHLLRQLILLQKFLRYEGILKVHFRAYLNFLQENTICILLVGFNSFTSLTLRMEKIIFNVEQIL